MGHYLDGAKGKVFFHMYKGRAFGVSLPTDGNKHYEEWHSIDLPLNPPIHIKHYKNGDVITIEVDLPEDIIDAEISIQ